MVKLNKERYGILKDLAKKYQNVYSDSVIEGYQSGDIWVDNNILPEVALVWHYCGFAYFIGKPYNDFLVQVYNIMQKKSERRFVLQVYDDDIDKFFSQKNNLLQNYRYIFKYQPKDTSEKHLIPTELKIREMNYNDIADMNMKIMPDFSWKSRKEFINKGKGFCITDGNIIVSEAFSSAISDKRIDIGLETCSLYKKKGLGAKIANEMVLYTLSQGKIPQWECNISNIGSAKTAEKVGFIITDKHSFYKAKI